MTNYFRITGYCPENDFCFIIDCYGMFDKKWQFSSMLIQKGLKILEISDNETFLDINITKVKEDKEFVFLRATANGKPKYIEQTIGNITYKAVQVADKIYIPDKTQKI